VFFKIKINKTAKSLISVFKKDIDFEESQYPKYKNFLYGFFIKEHIIFFVKTKLGINFIRSSRIKAPALDPYPH